MSENTIKTNDVFGKKKQNTNPIKTKLIIKSKLRILFGFNNKSKKIN